MDDGTFDLYDDSSFGTDNIGTIEPYQPEPDIPEPGTDVPVTGSGNGDLETLITGILDSYFQQDKSGNETAAGPDDLTGIKTDDKEISGSLDTNGTDTVSGNSIDIVSDDGILMDDTGALDKEGPDSELLTEIKDSLHTHIENVQSFFADTVSSNAVIMTPDDSTAVLLAQGVENQTVSMQNQSEILDRLDDMSVSVMLLFVVLAFDMIHRFAKRIVRNLMKGDRKNGTDI